MITLKKRERILAAIEGRPTDTIPYSFWTHLPGIDMVPEKLADATYDFYKQYDLDFIKVMSNGMYPAEDLGCTVDYSEIEKGGVARLVDTPIKEISDWEKIPDVDINKGAFARELKSLSLILEKLKDEDVPVLFTAFSPLTIADKISGNNLHKHIAEGGGPSIHKALASIAETNARLVEEAIELGADGVFFASQMSNYDVMGEDVYKEFGVPYDIQVVGASKGWFNAIHAHGNDIMFDLLKDYPVNVFNWHVGESLPAMDVCRNVSGKCLMGGIKRGDITTRNKNALFNDIYRSIEITRGRGLILTPGCVIRYPLDREFLSYVRSAKETAELALRVKGIIE